MLVLSRRVGERVVIDGGIITVTVAEVKGNRVRLAIDAPDDVFILRGELATWMDESSDSPLQVKPECLDGACEAARSP
jgi:carbon storage regulator CsrA